MSIEQIRTTAEVSRNTAKKYLAVLVKDGIAGVDDSGRYPKFLLQVPPLMIPRPSSLKLWHRLRLTTNAKNIVGTKRRACIML